MLCFLVEIHWVVFVFLFFGFFSPILVEINLETLSVFIKTSSPTNSTQRGFFKVFFFFVNED